MILLLLFEKRHPMRKQKTNNNYYLYKKIPEIKSDLKAFKSDNKTPK